MNNSHANTAIPTWHKRHARIINIGNMQTPFRATGGTGSNCLFRPALLATGKARRYNSGIIERSGSRDPYSVLNGKDNGKWSQLVWLCVDRVFKIILDRIKPAKRRCIFKEAVIHYPKDEMALKRIFKEIAVFRCSSSVKYMDTLKLDADQKTAVIDSLLQDLNLAAMRCLIS